MGKLRDIYLRISVHLKDPEELAKTVLRCTCEAGRYAELALDRVP
jgi:hypothetical protein